MVVALICQVISGKYLTYYTDDKEHGKKEFTKIAQDFSSYSRRVNKFLIFYESIKLYFGQVIKN